MHRLILAVVAVLACSGCFRATTTITLKQDGSGTIVQDVGATAQAIALLRNFAPAGNDKPSDPAQMFGPEQAKTAAAAMGVRFVSGEPVKTADLEGYRAHFAFDDVTKIRFNPSQTTPGATGSQATSSEPPISFDFVKREGGAVLTIRTSDGKGGLLGQMPGVAGSPQETAQAFAMVAPMLRGLFVDITLVVDGPIIKTTAPFVSGSQLTLLQFDFDKVTAAEGALQKLQQVTDPKMLKDIPGVRMLTDPVVTVEFGR